MKHMKRISVALLSVMMAFTFLVACGNGATDDLPGNESDTGSSEGTVINVATVNNPDMEKMMEVAPAFTDATGIEVNFDVLPEDELRKKLTQDVTMGTGMYDVMFISNYNAPIWGENGWIDPLEPHFSNMTEEELTEYDRGDLMQPVVDSLSSQDKLYALPFYQESNMLYYRKDLFEEAGIEMPETPTWDQVMDFAKQLHDPENGINGITLRGLPGWGQNMTIMHTMINSFGAKWFDKDWNPQFDTPEMREVFEFYKNILDDTGQPEPITTGYTEALAMMSSGKSAMWYDASVAGSVFEAEDSKVKGKIGYAKAPEMEKENPGGISGWALGIPSASKNKDAAFDFLTWVTSKEYIELIADKYGWAAVPPGTRESTYKNPEYKEVAPFADIAYESINNANFKEPAVDDVPYEGSIHIVIPEWQDLGDKIGQDLASYLSGNTTIDEALSNAQQHAKEIMESAGYYE